MLLIEPCLLQNFVEELEQQKPEVRRRPEMLLGQFGLESEGFNIEGIRNYAVQRVEPMYFDQLLERVQRQVSCPTLKSCLDEIGVGDKTERRNEERTMLSQLMQDEQDAIRRIQSIGNI